METSSSSALTARIERHILDTIKTANLTSGMTIPSEVQTVKELQISRGVVREAYRSLESLGLIEIKSGKRPIIKDPDPESLTKFLDFHRDIGHFSIDAILEAARGIELSAVQLAVQRANDDERKELNNIFLDLEKNVEKSFAFILTLKKLHETIISISANPVYTLFFQALYAQLSTNLTEALLSLSKKEKKKLLKMHKNIVNAFNDKKSADSAYAFIEYADTLKEILLNPKDTDE